MLRSRIIPVLLLQEESLVKTTNYSSFQYIGDPCNTVRIFNELEVDELTFLDVRASELNNAPNFELLNDIANECFMPLAYGGGISCFEHAAKIFNIGFEKVILNQILFEKPELITEISEHFGVQSVVASVDVKSDWLGRKSVFSNRARQKTGIDPLEWCQKLETLGVGEILLTNVDKEGTWSGIDVELIQTISDSLTIPLIAHGGVGKAEHIERAFREGNASAVAVGSFFVFQKKGMGVLVNFPERERLEKFITE